MPFIPTLMPLKVVAHDILQLSEDYLHLFLIQTRLKIPPKVEEYKMQEGTQTDNLYISMIINTRRKFVLLYQGGQIGNNIIY